MILLLEMYRSKKKKNNIIQLRIATAIALSWYVVSRSVYVLLEQEREQQ